MWIVPKRAEIVQRTKTRIVEIGGRWILLICKIFHFFITFLLKQFFGMTDIASLSWTETNLSCELKRKSCKKRKIPSESIWSNAVMTKNRITETFWGSENLNKKSRLRLTFEISAGQTSFVSLNIFVENVAYLAHMWMSIMNKVMNEKGICFLKLSNVVNYFCWNS